VVKIAQLGAGPKSGVRGVYEGDPAVTPFVRYKILTLPSAETTKVPWRARDFGCFRLVAEGERPIPGFYRKGQQKSKNVQQDQYVDGTFETQALSESKPGAA